MISRQTNTQVLKLLPKQREFMEDVTPELLYSGAFGAGKTKILCEKAYFLSIYYPNNFGLIVRKTMKSLRHTTLRTLLKGTGGQPVIPPNAIANYNKSDNLITLTNGSEIIYGGLDDPVKWGSLEVGWIAIDEAVEINEDDYTMLLGRLRQANIPMRQIFMATNPGAPSHFLYKKFYQDQPISKKDGSPLTKVIESNALQNTFNPEDYILRLDNFKGVYRDRFVLGKWAAFEGLVYPVFDPTRHVIDPFSIPDDWRRVCVIDFGYTNPFVCQWYTIDHDGTAYMYREIYMSHELVENHARQIKKLSKGENIDVTYADHDAGDRATLQKYGIPTQAAIKRVSPGIQEVYSNLTFDERGKARIYFFKNALVEADQHLIINKKPTCTVDEFGGYAWKDKSTKEEPIKENDHGMDCIRYFIYSELEFDNVVGLSETFDGYFS